MSESNKLENRLESIEQLLRSQALNNKVTLNLDEVVLYTGFSKLYLYKLTSQNAIPYYSPRGKKIFFKKEEIDKWLLNNRQATRDELEDEAISYAVDKL